LIREKTAGNPFFAIQFMSELYWERSLRFDWDALGWRWDIDALRAKGYTDNLADLMVTKLKRLPKDTCELLMLAACLGNTADERALALVYRCFARRDARDAEANIDEVLNPAMREGVLFRVGETYRFVHDRVQQAAYSFVPEAERPQIHLEIGR